MTALIVPVASTTSLIAPRSAFAVKCCAGVFRFRPKATNNPATTTTHAKMNHRPLMFISSSYLKNPGFSLITQCFNGIEPRRFSRRVIAEKHSDGDRKHGRNHDGLQGHLNGPT